MKIILASTSQHKLLATRRAFKKAFPKQSFQIIGVKAASKINDQPFGHQETFRGVLNRLEDARKTNPVFDYLVAVENGLIKMKLKQKEKFFDLAWVVVENSKGSQKIAFSSGIEIPSWAVEKTLALKDGFKKTTVGSVVARKNHCDPTDTFSFATNNLVSRSEMISQALTIVLGQFQKEKA